MFSDWLFSSRRLSYCSLSLTAAYLTAALLIFSSLAQTKQLLSPWCIFFLGLVEKHIGKGRGYCPQCCGSCAEVVRKLCGNAEVQIPSYNTLHAFSLIAAWISSFSLIRCSIRRGKFYYVYKVWLEEMDPASQLFQPPHPADIPSFRENPIRTPLNLGPPSKWGFSL